MTRNKVTEADPEIAAISIVYRALRRLTPEAQARVLTYVGRKLKVEVDEQHTDDEPLPAMHEEVLTPIGGLVMEEGRGVGSDELEGISPVARKWMTRNALPVKGLATIFSLGVDEIDLVAKTIPGKSMRGKMRSVALMKGIAAYIGTGVPRITYDQLKETCLHYQAYDPDNFARHLKSFSSEISGEKGTGYTLTARGLTSATELVKEMLQPPKAK